jgi:hypothetical protein
VALSLDLAPGSYAALYDHLRRHEHSRVIDDRAELIGTSLDRLAELYRGFWDAHVQSESLTTEDAARPIGEHHGALASWLMAPLRTLGTSAGFSARVRAAALTLADEAGIPDLDPFRIAVHGWVVGRVVGKIDNDGPVVPAPEAEDRHLRTAYAGLLEHVERVRTLRQMYEVAGSAIVWRFGGLTEALSPQPDGQRDNIGASLSRLVRDFGGELPTSLRGTFVPDVQDVIVRCRHALTHIAERDSFGFGDAAEHSTDEEFVRPIIQAASYFVCGMIGRELQTNEDLTRWSEHHDRVSGDLEWALEFS